MAITLYKCYGLDILSKLLGFNCFKMYKWSNLIQKTFTCYDDSRLTYDDNIHCGNFIRSFNDAITKRYETKESISIRITTGTLENKTWTRLQVHLDPFISHVILHHLIWVISQLHTGPDGVKFAQNLFLLQKWYNMAIKHWSWCVRRGWYEFKLFEIVIKHQNFHSKSMSLAMI